MTDMKVYELKGKPLQCDICAKWIGENQQVLEVMSDEGVNLCASCATNLFSTMEQQERGISQ